MLHIKNRRKSQVEQIGEANDAKKKKSRYRNTEISIQKYQNNGKIVNTEDTFKYQKQGKVSDTDAKKKEEIEQTTDKTEENCQ